MFELLIIGSFIGLIYYLTKKSKSKTVTDNVIIDTTSREYIQGYKDGFNDHKRHIENTHITRQFGTAVATRTSGSLVSAASTRTARPALSEAELSAKRHLQNINAALYMACFLLVIAAALFMGESLPEHIRFLGVWFVTISFYVSGLIIYRKSPRLKAAATAFIGTGLALLPFTGFALNYFVLHDPATSWFITSFVGLIGYIFAAAYLRSQTIVYFVIAFMVSLSTSSVASLDLALIWYFVALIMLGSILTLLANLKPKMLPSYFAEPIEKSNSLIVPLTIVASLFNVNNLVLSDYWLILAVCTVYYLAVAATAVTKNAKDYAQLAARIIGTVAILIATYDLTDSYVSLGLVMSMLGVVQIMLSTFSLPIKKAGDINNEVCLWLGYGLQLIAPFFVQSDISWPILVMIQMFSLLVGSFGVAYYLRRAELSIFGTIAAIVLPLVWGLHAMTPHIDGQWLALIFAGYITVVLAIRFLVQQIKTHPIIHQALSINFGLFLIFMLLCSVDIPELWLFTIWTAAAVFSYILVYLEKHPFLSILSNILSVAAIFSLIDMMEITGGDAILAMLWSSMLLFYLLYLVFVYIKKPAYGIYFWASAMISGLIFGAAGLVHFDQSVVTISGLGFVLAAIMITKRGWDIKSHILIDTSLIVATMGLQRVISVNITDLDFLVYTHWWALSFAMLSMLHLSLGHKSAAKVYTVLGLFMITFFGFIAAMVHMGDNTSGYSVLFFAEHAIMLIYGLIAAMKLQRNWGIVALILAMLQMMDGFNFALPAGVAIMLIIFAVKSLSKQVIDKH